MMDVARHPSRLCQSYGTRFDLTADRSVNGQAVGNDLTIDRRGLTDHHKASTDVAINDAVDVYFAVAIQIADNVKVDAYDRWRAGLLRPPGFTGLSA